MNNHHVKPAHISSTHGRSILPLPEEVIAQIKSSAAIVSLTGVVLELIKNSLDAKAARIEVTVDFARGACTVEDDGLGIAPLEFREDGGLGKLYCTSKHQTPDALLGRNGTFLASLSAVSLLSITSRHNGHRSHNSITFHHAQTIERQLPALSHHDINGKHGTRVTVRNLFGNLPVRVKQRSKVSEQKSESDRLWDSLKTNVVGLLLAWGGTVAVRARDTDNRIVFNFNTSDSKHMSRDRGSGADGPRSTHLTSMLNILNQANYVTFKDWPSWVPASASTSALSIKGAISLDPAPTKSVQFISLGVRPLSAELEHNELYDHVNRLFNLSSFGSIEEDVDLDDFEKFRRKSDRRFKSDGYTSRQLKARKGVDRHPMFHLRISLHGGLSLRASGDQFLEDEMNVQAIVDVLGAMITQWLSVHHFRPIQPRLKRKLDPNSTTSPRESSEIDDPSEVDAQSQLSRSDTAQSPLRTPPSSIPGVAARKKQCVSASIAKAPTEQLRHGAFAEWSRIKSAKVDFLTHNMALPKVDRTTCADFMLQPVAQGALNTQNSQPYEHEEASESDIENDRHDDTILWTDPLTKKTHLLNARTGCVMPNVCARSGTESVLSLPGRPKETSKSLRLPPNSARVHKTPWLDGVLKSWYNPVFKASEKRIEQVTLQRDTPDHGFHHHGPHRCSRYDTDKAFSDVPSVGSARLSRDSLLKAEVLAQVDKKFILVKATSSADTASAGSTPATFLVLLDQHAADERIQVETLYQELCAPISSVNTNPRYQSKLGHSAQVAFTLLSMPIQFTISLQERAHFITHAGKFADWGILYDIITPKTLSERGMLSKEQPLASVTALPPSISERCKSDAGLLISLLRSTVWKYANDPDRTSQVSISLKETSPEWVRRLATCPEGLIDMVNSRACRSAIMFNDELDLERCKQLVQNLAKCVFPFMCAHGRPSMVPLMDLGSMGNIGQESQPYKHGAKGGFAQVWKRWKR